MPLSKTQICNMALSCIGGGRIENIDEGSTASNACLLWYDSARQETLEGFDWSFARKRLDLALHGDDAPTDLWAYVYQWPADCLAPRFIENPAGPDADPIPYEVATSYDGEEKVILTNEEEASLWYTFDQQATDMFSAHFARCMARKLASLIAYEITGKESLEAAQEKKWAQMMGLAPAQEANLRQDSPPRESEFVRVR